VPVSKMITKSAELLVPIRTALMWARVLLFSLIITFTIVHGRYGETIDVRGDESRHNSVLEMSLRNLQMIL